MVTSPGWTPLLVLRIVVLQAGVGPKMTGTEQKTKNRSTRSPKTKRAQNTLAHREQFINDSGGLPGGRQHRSPKQFSSGVRPCGRQWRRRSRRRSGVRPHGRQRRRRRWRRSGGDAGEGDRASTQVKEIQRLAARKAAAATEQVWRSPMTVMMPSQWPGKRPALLRRWM